MKIKKGEEVEVRFHCVAIEDTDSSMLIDGIFDGFPTMRVFNPSYRVIKKNMKKTLADTKREIVNDLIHKHSSRDGRINIVLRTELEHALSTAIGQAFEDFKEVVKMEKREINILADEVVPWVLKGKITKKEIRSDKLGFNKAIDELQKRIKDYES